MNRLRALVPALVGVGAVCLASCRLFPGGGAISPVRLEVPRASLPSPGMCRLWDTGDTAEPPSRTCDGIEGLAPRGSQVVYRPEDGSHHVLVCYMSLTERARIDGVDVFDIDTGRHLEVIQGMRDPPVAATCREALSASKFR